MFGKTFPLFKLFGVQVQADLSWLIIVVLVTWSLAAGVFPAEYEELPAAVYWFMGGAAAVGLFGSIVLHELAHSLVALRCGIPMKRITLFIFGGVAEMGEEPKTPLTEFLVAIAGPVMSVVIAGGCLLIAAIGMTLTLPTAFIGVAWYLGLINLIIVLFNLAPAFPLDGGRVLRSILWHVRGDLKSATQITATLGSGFGMFLIFMGVFGFIAGNPVGGLWQFLIGMFLRNAAVMSYQRVLTECALRDQSLELFMNSDVQSVPPSITIQELVENYIYRLHHKLFPVMDHDHLLGCVTTQNVKSVRREDWNRVAVKDIMSPCSADNSIAAETPAMEALVRMSQHGKSRMMVMENDRLVGIVALKDLLDVITLRLELEEAESPSAQKHQAADTALASRNDAPSRGGPLQEKRGIREERQDRRRVMVAEENGNETN